MARPSLASSVMGLIPAFEEPDQRAVLSFVFCGAFWVTNEHKPKMCEWCEVSEEPQEPFIGMRG